MSGDLDGTASAVNLYQRMPQMPTMNTVKQQVPRLKIPEAIMEGKCDGYLTDSKTIEGQFFTFDYPAPGHSPVKLYYKYGGSHFGTMTRDQPLRQDVPVRTSWSAWSTSRSGWRARPSSPTSSCPPAPTSSAGTSASSPTAAATSSTAFTQCNHRVIVMQHKCIEPLGESKSDFQIFLDLAKRLGSGRDFLGGLDGTRLVQAAVRRHRSAGQVIGWKKFLKKGYYVVPAPPEELRDPVSFRWFAEGRREGHAGAQPVAGRLFRKGSARACRRRPGKLEFESSSLKRFDPDDPERPPLLKYVPAWEGPHAKELYREVSAAAGLAASALSPSTRRATAKKAPSMTSAITGVLVDGHYYWIVRVNSGDAKARGIGDGSLVKIFNDRGAVICAAQITDRLPTRRGALV